MDTKLKTYSIHINIATNIGTITSKSFHFRKSLPYIINDMDGNLNFIATSYRYMWLAGSWIYSWEVVVPMVKKNIDFIAISMC